HGRRLPHQRHSAADRADHGSPRRGVECRLQGLAGGCVCAGAAAHRPHGRAEQDVADRARPGNCRLEGAPMERVPIIQMGPALVVSSQGDMHDRLAVALEEELTKTIVATGAKGVLIDISALDAVDSFIGRMLDTISSVSRILDADTVVVGMRPSVAITLVELGLSLSGVKTALNVERGMAFLQQRLEAARLDPKDAGADEDD